MICTLSNAYRLLFFVRSGRILYSEKLEWAAVLKRRWILTALHLTVEVENIIIYLNYFWGKDICIMADHSTGEPMNQRMLKLTKVQFTPHHGHYAMKPNANPITRPRAKHMGVTCGGDVGGTSVAQRVVSILLQNE